MTALPQVRDAPAVPAEFLAASVVRLAGYRLRQQRFDEAAALASESIAIVERELGADTPIRLFGLITQSHVAARGDRWASGYLVQPLRQRTNVEPVTATRSPASGCAQT